MAVAGRSGLPSEGRLLFQPLIPCIKGMRLRAPAANSLILTSLRQGVAGDGRGPGQVRASTVGRKVRPDGKTPGAR